MARTNKSKVKRRPGPRGAESEERWDEIIHAAAAIFYDKGYQATSLQDIASAVGMLKGSIYYYIETKEDLLFELVSRAQDVWMSTLVEDEDTEQAPAPVRLRSFIQRWVALSSQQQEWGAVAEREFRRLSQPYYDKVVERRREFSAFVRQIIRQGIVEGRFDPGLDLGLATNSVFGLLHSSHEWRSDPRGLTATEIGDWFASFIIRGLGGQLEPTD